MSCHTLASGLTAIGSTDASAGHDASEMQSLSGSGKAKTDSDTMDASFVVVVPYFPVLNDAPSSSILDQGLVSRVGARRPARSRLTAQPRW